MTLILDLRESFPTNNEVSEGQVENIKEMLLSKYQPCTL